MFDILGLKNEFPPIVIIDSSTNHCSYTVKSKSMKLSVCLSSEVLVTFDASFEVLFSTNPF